MRRSFILSLMCFVCCLSYAQTANDDSHCQSWVETYARNIIQNNRQNPQEKVYLHMDNRSYFIGDTLFFKAYVFNASTHKLTRMSQVLYVELLGENGIEVDHKKLELKGGVCHGSFILKHSYRTGYYEIRAYTRYMLNWGNEPMPWMNMQEYIPEHKLHPYAITESQRMNVTSTPETLLENIWPTPIWQQSIVADANHCQFSRVFPVYMHPEKPGVYRREMDWYPMHSALAIPKETEEELRNDSLRISFYPEGGALVAGLYNRIAIDVHDQWGREKDIKGYVTEGRYNKDTITLFTASQRGRGTFAFKPERGGRYYAHVTYKGKSYCYKLPDAIIEGCSLSMNPPIGSSDASFTVNASQVESTSIGWTLLCRGTLVTFDTLSIVNGIQRIVNIPHDKLIPGVNQLTLFNARGEILAERLFFVPPPKEKAHINLVSEVTDTLKPFEEVMMKIQARANNGYFTQAHLSISITDATERGKTFDTGNLCSEMLLSSDLKGFIKDVDSYFRHTNDTTMAKDIDLLMMVQGWRRYEWKSLSDTYPTPLRYTPEKGLQIEGRVISEILPTAKFADATQYKRIGDLSMHIEMKDPFITLSDTFSVDSLGRFHVDFNKVFFGEIPMSITLGEKKSKGILNRLKFAYPVIDRVFSPSTTPYNYYQAHSPEDDQLRTMTETYDWQSELQIENVDIKRRRKRTREINFEYPDIVIDYYKEWNNIIDRGIPNANYLHSRDYYEDDRDREDGGMSMENEEDTPTDKNNENNEIRMHYTLGRSRLWGRIGRLEDSTFTYTEGRKNRYRVYLMPKTINVYTNLISREPMGTAIDNNTDTRAYAVWKPELQKRSLSPKVAPYMLRNGVRHTYCEGYSRVVSFYHRDYSGEELPDSTDYRRTLYWNPSLNTTSTGKAEITFYNNTCAKHVHIQIEGITRNGEFIVYDSDKPTN